MSSSGDQLRKILKTADTTTADSYAEWKTTQKTKTLAARQAKEEIKQTGEETKAVNEETEETELGATSHLKATDEASNAVDALSHTPWRIMHVFDPELFKTIALEQHGNVAALLLAIFLAIFTYHERITELKDRARENRDNTYIVTQLVKEKNRTDKDSKSDQTTFNPKLLGQVKEDLQKIADELFEKKIEIILTGDNPHNIQFELKYKIFPEEKTEIGKTESSLEKAKEKIISWVPAAVSNVWKLLTSYSMFYWLVWMTAILIAGASLTPALGFGLPAIIPALFLLWKTTEWVYNHCHPKTKAEINTQFNKLLIFRAYADKLLIAEAEKKIESKFEKHSDEIIDLTLKTKRSKASMATESEVEEGYKRVKTEGSSDAYDMELYAQYQSRMEEHDHLYSRHLSELFKNLFRRKTAILTYAIASALVTGYIVALFAQWPVTDLLIQVFNISSVGTVVTLTPMATFIVFGIALSIGLFLAIKQGIDKNNEIKENRKTAEDYRDQAAELQDLKKSYQAKKANLEARLSKVGEDSEEYKAWNELGIPDLEKESRSWIRRYIAMWITGAGSGVFIIRSILLTGCIIPLLLGPVSWTLSFAIAMTAGVIWGCFKLMELVQKQELERELEVIKHMPHHRLLYKQYNELLDLALQYVALPVEPAPSVAGPSSGETLAARASAVLVLKKSNQELNHPTEAFTVPKPTLTRGTNEKKTDGNP